MEEQTSWHLDKRVSVATIFAMAIQFLLLLGSGLMIVSEFKSQIETNALAISINSKDIADVEEEIAFEVQGLEKELDEINTEVDLIVANLGEQAVQLGRIDANVENLTESMERLIAVLEVMRPAQ